MLVMIIYNGFLFVSLRNSEYLYYILFVLNWSIFQLCFTGFDYQYLWPDSPLIHAKALVVSVGLAGAFLTKFTSAFLNLPVSRPKTNTFLSYSSWLLGGWAVISSLTMPYSLAIKVTTGLGILLILFILIIGIFQLKTGQPEAFYFVLAFFSFLIGTALVGLRNFGIL